MIESWQYDHHIYCEGNATPNSRRVIQDNVTTETGMQVMSLLISKISIHGNIFTASDVEVMPAPNSEERFQTV
jgi:hypothetical protein